MKRVFTIAICTYQRYDLLVQCLESLITKSVAYRDMFSVLVVDNNSSLDPRIQLSALEGIDHLDFSCVIEPTQGLSSARNRAIKECKTPWIIYLDDDTRVRDPFFKECFRIIEDGRFDVFTGFYQPFHMVERPSWFKNEYFSYTTLRNEIDYIDYSQEYVTGCIMGYKKSIFEKYDILFPLNKSMLGDKIVYGDETYVIEHLRAQNTSIGINPNLIVDHVVRQEQYTLAWLFRSALARGRDSTFLVTLPYYVLVIKFFESLLISLYGYIKGILNFNKDLLSFRSIIGSLLYRPSIILGQLWARFTS